MKALLTEKVVDGAEAPIKGECWIGDTKIRGFGLRVWRTSTGEVKKAFSLRMKGLEGKPFRRTFNPDKAIYELYSAYGWQGRWRAWDENSFPSEAVELKDISLGKVTYAARKWAQDEFDKVVGRTIYGNKGAVGLIRMTIDEERKTQYVELQSHIKKYTFSKAKDIQLKRMKTRGVSQSYLDRLDKIFEINIPKSLKSKNLFDLNRDEIKSTLLSMQKISNLKILRSFIGQIIDFPIEYGLRCQFTSSFMREINTPEQVPSSSLITQPKKLRALFEFLESQDNRWQQAFCLRLYFSMRAPLSRILSARWDQLRVNSYSRSDGTFKIQVLDWIYKDSWRSSERIDIKSFEILVKVQNKSSKEFGVSEYWFPSPTSHATHIKSANLLWEECLEYFDLNYMSPKALRNEYHLERYYGLDDLMGLSKEPLILNDDILAKLSM